LPELSFLNGRPCQPLISRIGKDKAFQRYIEKKIENSALKITDINPPDGGFLSKIFN